MGAVFRRHVHIGEKQQDDDTHGKPDRTGGSGSTEPLVPRPKGCHIPRDAQRDRLLGVTYPGKEKRVQLRVPQWNQNGEIGGILLGNRSHLKESPLVSSERRKPPSGPEN